MAMTRVKFEIKGRPDIGEVTWSIDYCGTNPTIVAKNLAKDRRHAHKGYKPEDFIIKEVERTH